MSEKQTRVLAHEQILQRIRRIAWQLYEEFQEEEQLLLAGIASPGHTLAELLAQELKAISPLRCETVALQLHKQAPLNQPIQLEPVPQMAFEKGCVVVVDDVLKSGSTLIYGVHHFLQYPLKKLKTVVLVDRSHKRYPVKADFKGLSLSTSLQEHVSVHLEKAPYQVSVS
jgi:pyrimidine operon attenuation protein/uracil phosphoribosyltransferase